MPVHEWTHVIVSYDGANEYHYINGGLAETGACPGEPSASRKLDKHPENRLKIGARGARRCIIISLRTPDSTWNRASRSGGGRFIIRPQPRPRLALRAPAEPAACRQGASPAPTPTTRTTASRASRSRSSLATPTRCAHTATHRGRQPPGAPTRCERPAAVPNCPGAWQVMLFTGSADVHYIFSAAYRDPARGSGH